MYNVDGCISFVNKESFLLGFLEHVDNIYIAVNSQIQNILLKILKILEQKEFVQLNTNSLWNKFACLLNLLAYIW